MNTTTDERQGHTSASNAEADLLCPGRHLASRGLPEGPKTPDSERGIRIHAFLAREKVVLNDEETECAEKCIQLEEIAVRLWGGLASMVYREARFWTNFGYLQHSGKADKVYVDLIKGRALVLDYKSGRDEATENPRNLQLRDLACLIAAEIGLKEVTVQIIQPYAQMHQPCVYNFSDLAQAIAELEDRVKASNDPKSPRIPGPIQCKFCKAKGTTNCPEFTQASMPVAIGENAVQVLPAAIRAMDGDRLGLFYGLVKLAAEVAEDEARKRLGEGLKVNGLRLSPGRFTEKITDPQTVFNRFVAIGGDVSKFMPCVTVGKGKLKDALKGVTEKKGKALDKELEALIEGATESKQSAPILEHE